MPLKGPVAPLRCRGFAPASLRLTFLLVREIDAELTVVTPEGPAMRRILVLALLALPLVPMTAPAIPSLIDVDCGAKGLGL